MLTFAFLAALAIHVCKSRLQWTVRNRADESFALDGSILRRKQYLFSKLQFDNLVVFFNLFLKFQTLHINTTILCGYYTDTCSNTDWAPKQMVTGSHLLPSDNPKYSRKSSPSGCEVGGKWMEGRAHTDSETGSQG